MMNYPLLLKSVLYRATTVFPEQEIVTRTASGIERYTYQDLGHRAAQVAHALDELGVQAGDKVASFAWNDSRHLELYYGVPLSNRVLHTVNIRLSKEQIAYTINHAEDRVLFISEDLVPIIAPIANELDTVHTFVVMTANEDFKEYLPSAVSYEQLIASKPTHYSYPDMDENAAAIMAYTSATTGDPKGVLYSHRGLYLHCLTQMTGMMSVDNADASMPIVPMFHVNAWGRPYADLWGGAKLVLPGAHPTPGDLADLIQNEKVTLSAGVPTVWMGILQHVRANPGKYDFSHARMFMSGGSALPFGLTKAYQEELGVKLYQGYGQTETTPVTFVCTPKARYETLEGEELYRLRAKTGMIVPGLEMKLVDESGNEVPYDGVSRGELLLRGPWIIHEYYKNEAATAAAFVDGWFRTGDIAVMGTDGYLQVVDRTKDLIKSGGEWISSVDLENTLMSHPDVAEAAVISIPDAKWQERPLACVVIRPEAKDTVTEDTLRTYLTDKVAKFWIPDHFVFIDEVPKTSVGKFSKKTLREWYQAGQLLQVHE